MRTDGSLAFRSGRCNFIAAGKPAGGKRRRRRGIGNDLTWREICVLGGYGVRANGIGFWRNARRRARSVVGIVPSEIEANAESGADTGWSTLLFVRARRDCGAGFSGERVNAYLERAWGA